MFCFSHCDQIATCTLVRLPTRPPGSTHSISRNLGKPLAHTAVVEGMAVALPSLAAVTVAEKAGVVCSRLSRAGPWFASMTVEGMDPQPCPWRSRPCLSVAVAVGLFQPELHEVPAVAAECRCPPHHSRLPTHQGTTPGDVCRTCCPGIATHRGPLPFRKTFGPAYQTVQNAYIVEARAGNRK